MRIQKLMEALMRAVARVSMLKYKHKKVLPYRRCSIHSNSFYTKLPCFIFCRLFVLTFQFLWYFAWLLSLYSVVCALLSALTLPLHGRIEAISTLANVQIKMLKGSCSTQLHAPVTICYGNGDEQSCPNRSKGKCIGGICGAWVIVRWAVSPPACGEYGCA